MKENYRVFVDGRFFGSGPADYIGNLIGDHLGILEGEGEPKKRVDFRVELCLWEELRLDDRTYWIERSKGIYSFPSPDLDKMTTEQIKERVLLLESAFDYAFREEDDEE